MTTPNAHAATNIASPTTAVASSDIALSIIIISFNAQNYLRRCLQHVAAASTHLAIETFVVDNLSTDNSCTMVEQEFPEVKLIRSTANLGFAAANNLAMHQATGRYFLLLNSDCFVEPDALEKSIQLMDQTPKAAAAGPHLTFADGSYQVSARLFPSLLSDFFTLSGLSARYPRSRFFARADRTWQSPNQPTPVDWVTGAFMLLRASALKKIGLLDENFYFYHEDLDLCVRIRKAGFQVWYFPQIRAIHIGGGSAAQLHSANREGGQIILWRTHSLLFFHRKHHGPKAALVLAFELAWFSLRAWRNRHSRSPQAAARYAAFNATVQALRQSWHETKGGRISPPRPW